MRILIIYPPCRESNTPVLPLGLLYVAQPLIEDGHSVRFFDIALEKPDRKEVISKITSEKFDLIITGGIITTYSYLKWLTNEIKTMYPDIPILGGGFVAAPIPHVIFKNTGIDVICNGEGDVTVKEYVSAIENFRDITEVYGLFIKKGKSFITTPERPLIKNLDDISPPIEAYKLLNMERYIVENGKSAIATMESEGKWEPHLGDCRYFDIISGRGCVGRCTFCYRMIKGIRKNSVPYVIRHMEYLADNYKVNFFQFEDDLFIYNKNWLDEFCKAVKDSNMDIRFSISSRADMITEENLTKLKSAGCVHIGVGFESGSQHMLDSMKKHIKIEHNYTAYKLLKKYNMVMGAPTIIGMPGETKDTINETLKFIQECKMVNAANYYATPYPNSDIYQYALKEGLIKDEDRYLEMISNSDASEFKINLTKLPDSDLIFYHWLLADATRKNKLQDGRDNNKIKSVEYYKFIAKHIGIKLLYKLGLFKLIWNFNSKIEFTNKDVYKI